VGGRAPREAPRRTQSRHGTFAFHEWIRQAVAADMPYSEFVRSILTASGDERKNPPSSGTRNSKNPRTSWTTWARSSSASGSPAPTATTIRTKKWSQDDYWGLASFFARVGRKNVLVAGSIDQNGRASR